MSLQVLLAVGCNAMPRNMFLHPPYSCMYKRLHVILLLQLHIAPLLRLIPHQPSDAELIALHVQVSLFITVYKEIKQIYPSREINQIHVKQSDPGGCHQGEKAQAS